MNKRANKYNSDILGELFSEITPQEQKRTDNKMLLAAKIKDGMNAKGWRNKHLSEALSQRPSVITKWLSGTHNFTSDTLSDIEDILSIKLLNTEAKKESQVAHYHVQLTTTVIHQDPVRAMNKLYPFSKSTNQALC